jgi:hypothetical protein
MDFSRLLVLGASLRSEVIETMRLLLQIFIFKLHPRLEREAALATDDLTTFRVIGRLTSLMRLATEAPPENLCRRVGV